MRRVSLDDFTYIKKIMRFLWQKIILHFLHGQFSDTLKKDWLRKRLQHRYFSVNFVKVLGKLFCWTPASNHISHGLVFFLLFAHQWYLQPNINLFDGNSKLGEGIHKLVQCCEVMEIKWKLHCQVVATHVPTWKRKKRKNWEIC